MRFRMPDPRTDIAMSPSGIQPNDTFSADNQRHLAVRVEINFCRGWTSLWGMPCGHIASEVEKV